MNDAQQAHAMLRQFLAARREAPWVAEWFVYASEKLDLWQGPRRCIQRLGGMESWDTGD